MCVNARARVRVNNWKGRAANKKLLGRSQELQSNHNACITLMFSDGHYHKFPITGTMVAIILNKYWIHVKI